MTLSYVLLILLTIVGAWIVMILIAETNRKRLLVFLGGLVLIPCGVLALVLTGLII